MSIIATDSQNYDNIASAIRTKNGLTTEYKPSEMAQAILDIPAGSVSGTINLSENGTFNVASYASVNVNVPEPSYMNKYHSATAIKTFTDLSATSVQYGAFAYTESLNTVSFPEVVTIGSHAFANCYLLSSVYFPKCTTINPSAFQYCSSLSFSLNSTTFPALRTIGAYAFRGCQHLTGVDLSQVTTVNAQTFSACSRITSVKLAACTTANAGAFSYLTTCTEYSLPKLQYIRSSCFYSNYHISTLTLPSASNISAYAFRYCSSLMSLYLPGSSVPTLQNATVFANMPMSVAVGGVYGSIYVPSSMVATYKAAAYWSTYKNRIVAIPE